MPTLAHRLPEIHEWSGSGRSAGRLLQYWQMKLKEVLLTSNQVFYVKCLCVGITDDTKRRSFLLFRLDVTKGLINNFSSRKSAGRSRSSEYTEIEWLNSQLGHWPVSSKQKLECVVLHKKGKTTFMSCDMRAGPSLHIVMCTYALRKRDHVL